MAWNDFYKRNETVTITIPQNFVLIPFLFIGLAILLAFQMELGKLFSLTYPIDRSLDKLRTQWEPRERKPKLSIPKLTLN